MYTIEIVARDFLHFTGTYTIVIFAAIIFILNRGHKYVGLLYLLFLTMLYNTILKLIFKLPLPETCPGTGYAFPSGHMNFASVFYFWLMVTNKKITVRLLSLLLLTTTGFCLVLAGYHFTTDVLITPVFAIAAITIYRFIESKVTADMMMRINVLTSIILLLINYYMHGSVQYHISLAYGMIIGIALGSTLFITKAKASLLPLSGLLLIVFLLSLDGATFLHILSDLRFIAVAIGIVALVPISNILLRRIRREA